MRFPIARNLCDSASRCWRFSISYIILLSAIARCVNSSIYLCVGVTGDISPLANFWVTSIRRFNLFRICLVKYEARKSESGSKTIKRIIWILVAFVMVELINSCSFFDISNAISIIFEPYSLNEVDISLNRSEVLKSGSFSSLINSSISS